MYIIDTLRFNKFRKVNLPTRRQMFERFARSGLLQTTHYSQPSEGDEYGDPINFTDGMNKIDMMSAGQQMLKQSYDASSEKADKQ